MATQSTLRSRGMELLLAYYQNPSLSLRNQLVSLNAGLVRKVAYRLSYQCTEPYEDLEQIGYIGLIRAIERFNPNQGCAFSSFAVPYIRGEILHFLRDRGSTVKVPRRWQELHKEGQRLREELLKQLGTVPSDQQIADALQVSLQDWLEAKQVSQNRLPLSLDSICQQTDSCTTLGETLPDPAYQSLQRLEEERQQIQGALSQLEAKTRAAIEFVFIQGLSRKEVAKRIGVSPMTVSRRIQRGLRQLTLALQAKASLSA
ncbi:RNA polymerase sigma factor SigF [Trichothermofontia sichuanensis B231]|uniref:RNA polymerase sigma factor SigF n=1 Tax=Trichothermofontia sichuanensis TaxID=3045816 RepID=UPI0022484A0D|nr:RNA polymerase sigma factor SigF [Trichothermofontia sichuanensis]UZQ52761.1 RNA polymerase sigma factor SigF [Trichothermofontia sichuanensis B231]